MEDDTSPRLSLPSKSTLRFPSLGSPPSYQGFIKALYREQDNKKALTGIEKKTVDEEYERLLRQQLEHDEKAFRRYAEAVCWSLRVH